MAYGYERLKFLFVITHAAFVSAKSLMSAWGHALNMNYKMYVCNLDLYSKIKNIKCHNYMLA